MLITARAQAHAPLPRAVRARDGYVALSLPGFGMVVRAAEGERFRYACDALLGTPPGDKAPPLHLRPDGTLLIGTYNGLRAMGPDGCPRTVPEALLREPVYALAASGSTLFAVVGDALWRSLDAGDSWELRGAFESGNLTTGLVFAGGTLYASNGARVLVSSDEGASFEASLPGRPMTLLAVRDGVLWTVARTAMPVGSRGYEVWRGEQGAWRSVLTLNYFGGLTIDQAGTVWVGDEGGGLHRSLDGETFTEASTDLYPSCLESAGERLYSCNADLPMEPALYLGNAEARAPVTTLDTIDEMVACEGVQRTCALAWVEWQRDVLGRLAYADGGLFVPDAGVPDAGVHDAAVQDAALVDAGSFADAGAVRPRDDDGCTLGGRADSGWWLALGLLARRRQLRRA